MSASPIPLLIVEDNPVYAEILQELLPTLGGDLRFELKWVDSAEKALDELSHTNYEVVLLDYKLPGADGLTVLSQICSRPTDSQPAVIMLTGMGNEEIAVQAMKSGAKDYLPKDALDVPSLIRAISGSLERKRLEQQVARYTAELRDKNAQMEADLNMAQELQQALLPNQYPSFPQALPLKESALRFYHRYRPTVAVGGDFFDITTLSETKAGVFICDVMGHGVRAALVTAILRALVEDLAPLTPDPGEFLGRINRRLVGTLRQTRMPLFASAFYLTVDVADGRLEFASAGHPSPYHVCRDRGVVQPLSFNDKGPGPALGVFEDSKYPVASQEMSEHDLVMLFTDGLYEVDGSGHDQYGQERLLAAVRERVHLPPAQLFDEVLADVQRYAHGKDFQDDVCLVGVELERVGVEAAAEKPAE